MVFLDIDGVLNRQGDNIGTMRAECVNEFNRILKEVPAARLVISSAWRHDIFAGRMTHAEFESMLCDWGVDCYGRMVGITKVNGKPRIEQICDWLDENPGVTAFVVLDDIDVGIKRQVRTDMKVGITRDDADAAIEILNDRI